MNYSAQIIIFIKIISFVTGQFGYSKREQQIWAQKFKSCAGKLQSPISISTSKAIPVPLPALEVVGYHDPLPGPLKLKNNGHSVAVLLASNNTLRYSRLPYIFGAALKKDQEYEIDHLHFHWGARNNRGSEHILNGIRFPMEMHIVHRNRVYFNLSNSLNFKDGVVVLGIFFRLEEEDNKLLSPILNDLPKVQWFNNEIKLNTSITLASLMPYNTDVFYTYKGSLTTPPCTEAVTWIIYPTPVPISFKQINKFRSLFSGDDILADNYRQLQDTGLRKVYVRRINPSFIAKYNATLLNVTNLSWFWK